MELPEEHLEYQFRMQYDVEIQQDRKRKHCTLKLKNSWQQDALLVPIPLLTPLREGEQ